MPRQLTHLCWTTNDELRYLAKIGTWAPVGSRRYGMHPENRIKLLQQYLKTMEKRVRWGELNISIIFGYISIELKRLGVRS